MTDNDKIRLLKWIKRTEPVTRAKLGDYALHHKFTKQELSQFRAEFLSVQAPDNINTPELITYHLKANAQDFIYQQRTERIRFWIPTLIALLSLAASIFSVIRS